MEEGSPDNAEMSSDYFFSVAARRPLAPIDCHIDLIVSEGPIIRLAKVVFWRLLAHGGLRVHQLRGEHLAVMRDSRLVQIVNRIFSSSKRSSVRVKISM